MTTPDLRQRAKEYSQGYGHGMSIPTRMKGDIEDGLSIVMQIAFEAGAHSERLQVLREVREKIEALYKKEEWEKGNWCKPLFGEVEKILKELEGGA